MKAELDKLAKEAGDLAAQLGVKAPKRQAPKQVPQPAKTFFSSVEESVDELPVAKPVAPKATAKKAKKASKKAAKKAAKQPAKVAIKAAKEVRDDWSRLSPSTLKRKTVKDLSEYLEEKVRFGGTDGLPLGVILLDLITSSFSLFRQGHKTTDANGKPLRKADLVDAVLSVTA